MLSLLEEANDVSQQRRVLTYLEPASDNSVELITEEGVDLQRWMVPLWLVPTGVANRVKEDIGWATNATIYVLDTGRISSSYWFDAIKEFHKAKTPDPITGVKRPTVFYILQ